MGRGLDPAAEILLLRKQVAKGFGKRHMVTGNAQLQPGVRELTGCVVGAPGPASNFLENTPVAPGEAELAVQGDDAVELVGRQVAPILPRGLEERTEAFQDRAFLTRDLALEVGQDASLLALGLEGN